MKTKNEKEHNTFEVFTEVGSLEQMTTQQVCNMFTMAYGRDTV